MPLFTTASSTQADCKALRRNPELATTLFLLRHELVRKRETLNQLRMVSIADDDRAAGALDLTLDIMAIERTVRIMEQLS